MMISSNCDLRISLQQGRHMYYDIAIAYTLFFDQTDVMETQLPQTPTLAYTFGT
jgi:hypothetical protein